MSFGSVAVGYDVFDGIIDSISGFVIWHNILLLPFLFAGVVAASWS